MFVSALPDPTCNSEKSANGGNKQILLLNIIISSSSSNYRINNSLPNGVFQRYNEPIIQMEHK